jgi:hypothetical protein
MKIKILKNVDIDIDKTRLQEVWPKYLSKNDIFDIEKIFVVKDPIIDVNEFKIKKNDIIDKSSIYDQEYIISIGR